MSNLSPILITAPARSGTSCVAGIVHICGAWGGKMAGPNSNNKKGMFENTEIRNGIVKPFLRKFGFDPLCQNPLPDDDAILLWGTEEYGAYWETQIVREIRKQGYRSGPWFYKGAKMVLMWSLWHKAFPFAKWIYVNRDKEDIISSCLKTGFMRAYKGREGWSSWVDVHIKRKQEMIEAGIKIIDITPHKFIKENDFEEIKQVVLGLGLTWREEKVRAFVSPNLWGKR